MRKALCISLLLLGACSSSGPKPLPEPDGEEFVMNLDQRAAAGLDHPTNDLIQPIPAARQEIAP